MATSQADTLISRELELVVFPCPPVYNRVASIFLKCVQEVFPSPIEFGAELPLFIAKATEGIAFILLHNQQSILTLLGLFQECPNRASIRVEGIKQGPVHQLVERGQVLN
jgi:hypothetical protein